MEGGGYAPISSERSTKAAALLDGELTVFETIDRIAVGEIRTKIKDILGAFMFGGDDVHKKVKVLSCLMMPIW